MPVRSDIPANEDRIVPIPVMEAPCVDEGRIAALRSAMGPAAFEAAMEEALFHVIDLLARVEAAAGVGDPARAARFAASLAEVAGPIGLTGMARAAENLARCRAGDDWASPAAPAVAARLIRIGEDSLVRAAELTAGRREGA